MSTSLGKREEYELALETIKTLIYFKVRAINLTLVRAGLFFIGSSKNRIRKERERDSVELGDLLEVFLELKKMGKLKEVQGMYGWDKGFYQEELGVAEQRKLAVDKIQRAMKIMRVVRHLPLIRMVAINGTVAVGNPGQGSDIDFLVVARRGRIWLTRILLAGVLELMGKRKKERKRRDRICLNHFITDESLRVKDKDLYSALEYAQMICLLDRNETRKRFRTANGWIRDYLINLDWEQDNQIPGYWQEKMEESGESWLFKISDRWLGSGWFDGLERLAAKWQGRRIKKKRATQQGGQVYWGRDALIFHPRPKSFYFAGKYRTAMEEQKEEIKGILCNGSWLEQQARVMDRSGETRVVN